MISLNKIQNCNNQSNQYLRMLRAYFFAGVNGAGKITLYYNEIENKIKLGYRINIDEIVSSFGEWKNPQDQMKASKIAISMRRQCLEQNLSFNQETTLCGNSILKTFKELKEKKY